MPTHCTQCGIPVVSSRTPVKGLKGVRRHACGGLCTACYDKGRKRTKRLPCKGECGRPAYVTRATSTGYCRKCYDSKRAQVVPPGGSSVNRRAVRIVEEEVIYFRNVWCYDDARIAKKLGMKEDTLRRYIEIAEKEGVLAA